jgi:cupin 2 domain-containing protein
MIHTGRLDDHAPPAAGGEVFTELLARSNTRIERIVSNCAASPPGFWYDQPQAEWVLLVRGSAVLEFEGAAPVALESGDWIEIPPHARHRVARTGPDTLWLAVHVG